MTVYRVMRKVPGADREILSESTSKLEACLRFEGRREGIDEFEVEIDNGKEKETYTVMEFFRKWLLDIRNMTGLSQQVFAKEYGIPRRTIENWESKNNISKAPAYVLALLERVVSEDYGPGDEPET